MDFTDIDPRTADLIMHQIAKNGYSTGEATAADPRCGLVWIIDASKDGECWVVTCPSRYEAAVELMIILGWDLKG